MEGNLIPVDTEVQNMRPLVDDNFIKGIAMAGPGLVAVVRAPDMSIVFANDQFANHIGCSNTDLSPCRFTDLLDDYQRDRFISHLNNVRQNVEAQSGYSIFKVRSRSGAHVAYYLYASPVASHMDAQGEMYYLFLQPDLSRWGMPFTSFDTKELFLEQFDAEDFGTFEWILDVDKVYWSAGLYRIYEVDQSNTRITNLFARSFVHPADKPWVTEAVKEAIDSAGNLNIEFRIITTGKNVKVLHALARVIKDSHGKSIKFAGSIRDITEQRFIENDLKNKVAELNHSNRELEEFAYVASHDLQEPLRKITTFSDRLSDKYKDVLTGEGAMYLSRMIASAENMRTLINDLLEFSRVTKSVAPFAEVDLNSILRQVKTDLELVIEETGTTVESDELPVIDAIGSQMKQLFSNIINNAIKFRTPDVAPLIRITVATLDDESQLQAGFEPGDVYYRIVISDNGIGFEPEYAIRIFQVFQRLHGKSDYPGSGIGLAICKKIIEYHRGTLFAESQPGEGSRFTFILPGQQAKPKGNK